jgi:hypothetical protein
MRTGCDDSIIYLISLPELAGHSTRNRAYKTEYQLNADDQGRGIASNQAYITDRPTGAVSTLRKRNVWNAHTTRTGGGGEKGRGRRERKRRGRGGRKRIRKSFRL